MTESFLVVCNLAIVDFGNRFFNTLNCIVTITSYVSICYLSAFLASALI